MQHIARDHVEEFCLVFVRSGTCERYQRGAESAVTPHGMYIINASEPYRVRHSAGTQVACLTVPCDLLRPRVRGIDDMIKGIDYADGMVAGAIQNLVEKAIVTARVTTDERVEALCLDMIALMLTSKRS